MSKLEGKFDKVIELMNKNWAKNNQRFGQALINACWDARLEELKNYVQKKTGIDENTLFYKSDDEDFIKEVNESIKDFYFEKILKK